MVELGHVAYYVRDLKQSLRFYHEGLGLEIVGRLFNGRAAMLSGGRTHHELLLIEAGSDSPARDRHAIGTYHVAWKIGDDLQALSEIKQKLTSMNYPPQAVSDHTVSQSLYLVDPDGNQVEIYVDNPDIDWRSDTSWMQQPVKPLKV